VSARVREHLRANVVGYVAIFLFAVGGTAIAANTVRTEDIVNGEVHSIDVTNNNLQGVDVRDDTVTGADVLEDTLGQVPSAALAARADSVAQGAVTTPTIRTGAVTPTKLSGFPAVSVLTLAAETIPNNVGMILHSNFEIYDTDGIWDPSTGAENLVAPVTGTYYVSATVDWDPNSTGFRRMTLMGPTGNFASVAGPPLPSPAFTSQNPSGIERLSAGQAVQVSALQGSGADLGARIARFEMALIGR
jgi:hypothetical protein